MSAKPYLFPENKHVLCERELAAYEIEAIDAREILDSRGNPTIEVKVRTKGGASARASVPSGRSVGIYEAVELRDGGERYHGMGVLKAVANVKKIIQGKLKGADVRNQESIDEAMLQTDGTDNKSVLGSNAILGVSIACAKTASMTEEKPLYAYIGGVDARLLPVPFMNIINGGKHAGNPLDFQEHMLIPLGAKSFSESLRIGAEVYQELRSILEKTYGRNAVNVGDEGGFTPPIRESSEAFSMIMKAVEAAGYTKECFLGLDVAASSLFKGKNKYSIGGKLLNREELIRRYESLSNEFPVISIEDPLEEDDFEGFAHMTKEMGIQIVGDDIFATNIKRLKIGIEKRAANSLLWKVNQVGTLTEALRTADMAKSNGYSVQVSHRSGDTEDTFVADLSVSISAGQIKTGAPCRGERTAKYNRLLQIEEELGSRAVFSNKLSYTKAR